MPSDRIETEITIAAKPDRVWEVLTDPSFVGQWFGTASPPQIDLTPGGTMQLDFGTNGTFPNRIVTVDPPRSFSYRSASGFPGATPTDENSTLVEFSLTEVPDGTVLRLTETGFDAIALPPEQKRSANYNSHAQGWPYALQRVRDVAEQAAA